MGRGNRQGNNAFMENDGNFGTDPHESFMHSTYNCFEHHFVSLDLFKQLEKILKSHGDLKQNMSHRIIDWLRFGNYVLPRYFLEDMVKHSNYGFNELHLNVLKDYKGGKTIPEFKSVSVIKKSSTVRNATPLHFACINPDSNVLD